MLRKQRISSRNGYLSLENTKKSRSRAALKTKSLQTRLHHVIFITWLFKTFFMFKTRDFCSHFYAWITWWLVHKKTPVFRSNENSIPLQSHCWQIMAACKKHYNHIIYILLTNTCLHVQIGITFLQCFYFCHVAYVLHRS